MSQDETNSVAGQVVDELERIKAWLDEIERIARRAQESAETVTPCTASDAKHVQELAEVAANVAREQSERLAGWTQEERERTLQMRKETERVIAAARKEAERAQKAEEMARVAAEETKKAIAAKEEVERRLKGGIQHAVMPSPKDIAAAKRPIQYRKDCFHFAVAGISGSSKSSLINAFRGLRTQDAAAAPVAERTPGVSQYPDPSPENPFVWYEIPDTSAVVKYYDWQYFNDQGLYIFDSIVILFENHLTATDIAILAKARSLDIPTYIIRSKADCWIRSIMADMGHDNDGDDQDVERRTKLYNAARTQFIKETEKNVQACLEKAGLPGQRVYIISSDTLLSFVQNKMPKKTIDEAELLHDIFDW